MTKAVTADADYGARCDDVLVIAPVAEVRVTCILAPGHKGFCVSRDGRRWARPTMSPNDGSEGTP